ncbi:transcriptional repressor [Acidaminobacter sp. JC074]|uniref:Fur family transcriptional regulator n=1 Tax=Acidaminobacter sp. JC074 TaxID=2530199 RepID=UPI001F0D87BD|nr:Fur family transcriptional regulator [Acidaminobacter sp. JC074]MCH4888786.1 transcriptional repressor [Acidaminobacter sp. JC074]
MEMTAVNEKLKKKGYKFTPQRKAILEVVSDSVGQHLSSEEIYDLVKVKNPEIGLATVYRTVQLLVELDILSKLNLDDGFVRYEMNDHDGNEHHHHHLICSQCGRIDEVKEDLLESIEKEIEMKYEFQIRDHKLKFFGLCKSCKENL